MRGVVVLVFLLARAGTASDPVLEKARAKMKESLARQPDFVCAQRIERKQKAAGDGPYKRQDELRLEVTLLGGKERYAWADSSKFEDRELRDLVNRGVVGTGAFGLFSRHLFQPGAAEFTPRGEEDFEGRRVARYDYDVPWENSTYKISVPPHETTVAFRGHFLVDLATYDLALLEVTADEIPTELGLDRVRNLLRYGRVPVGNSDHLFAVRMEQNLRALDGGEHLNNVELGECRRYAAESKLSFAEEPPEVPDPAGLRNQPAGAEPTIAPHTEFEVELSSDINLDSVAAGEQFRAVLTDPLKNGEKVIFGAGTLVAGRVVRVERQAVPFDRYEVAIELVTIEGEGRKTEIAANLRGTGGASGLIREQKTLMPVFNKRRSTRFDVLVREAGRGQGVLYWDAKHPRIRKGFKMKWRIEEARP